VSVRAGIVVTGTEVLDGWVSDANGPWVSVRLAELGVEHAHTVVTGDRDEDLLAALRFLAETGMDVIFTTGGLGPTEDDRTAAVVGAFQGREMVLDEPTEARIWEIVSRLRDRWPHLTEEALRASNRKQALVPRGAEILAPVGTAPGLVGPPAAGRAPLIVVLPGPPRELQGMWPAAVASAGLSAVLERATRYRFATLRLFGIPEAEIADTLVRAQDAGVALDRLEVTTCLRRGEVEVVTRWEPEADDVYAAFLDVVRGRHPRALFSEDGTTVDQQVAALLRDARWMVATAESCTGGLLAGRLTELPGSSDYVAGGLVVYTNAAKSALAGVAPELIDRVGAVSEEVAAALADGACAALSADVGIGITGIAGPGGGTPSKPVGLVWVSVCTRAGARITRRLQLPGSRADVRERTTTVALHLLRRLLLGERD
jgi:nicotinamide-nucleotide amidase